MASFIFLRHGKASIKTTVRKRLEAASAALAARISRMTAHARNTTRSSACCSQVILHYLREQIWLERNGAIIFGQYRTTAEWVLEAQCAAFPNEPVALYVGGAASQCIGQVRDDVHVLNLRYAGTVEDDVYAALSDRFGDIFSVLGQLPDGFEDQWIEAALQDRQAVKNFSQRVEKEKPPMELRYMRDVADDRGLDWEDTERVLSSRDLEEWMRQGS